MTADDFFRGIPEAGGLSPVGRRHPAHCGDSHMRVARDGAWFHDGSPIRRAELVLLAREGEGPEQYLTFTTNVGDRVLLGPEHGPRIAEDVPYLRMLCGLGAKRARAVHYPLADLALQKDGMLGVWSGGVFFALSAA